MWEINKRNLWIAFLLVAVGVVFLVLGFIADPTSKADDGTSLKSTLYLIGFIYLGVIAAVFVVFFLYSSITRRRLESARAGWLHGTAIIVSARATGDTANNIPLVEMKLRIEVEGRPAYEVDHREHVNPVSLAALQGGARIPVLVDPDRPKKIILDW